MPHRNATRTFSLADAVVDAGANDDRVGVLTVQFHRRRGRRNVVARRPSRIGRLGRGQHERRRTIDTPRGGFRHRRVAGQRRRRVEGGGGPELFRVALVPQPAVDAATAAQQDLIERRAEVAVETGVDDRVEKAVGKAEPQEEAEQPLGDGAFAVLVAERSD